MVSKPTSTCWKKSRWIITAKIEMKVSGAMSASWPSSAAAASS